MRSNGRNCVLDIPSNDRSADLRYSCTKEKVADACFEHSRAMSRAVHRLPY